MVDRIKMKLNLADGYYKSNEDVNQVFYEMSDELANTMYKAYSNSVDFEGDTLEDFQDEISNVFKGLYGEFMPNLSSVIEKDDKIIGGLLLCIFKGEPTITYLFTNPDYQRKDVATILLENTCYKLLNEGFEYLYLYLNLNNIPAYNLFDKFGFNEVIYNKKKNLEDYYEYNNWEFWTRGS